MSNTILHHMMQVSELLHAARLWSDAQQLSSSEPEIAAAQQLQLLLAQVGHCNPAALRPCSTRQTTCYYVACERCQSLCILYIVSPVLQAQHCITNVHACSCSTAAVAMIARHWLLIHMHCIVLWYGCAGSAPASAPTDAVTFRLVPEVKEVPAESTTVKVVVSLKATSEVSNPANIALVTVVDKSSSMGGSKIELVRDTVQFVAEQLGPQDALGLVTYSRKVSREVFCREGPDVGYQSWVEGSLEGG